jgi:hypothetical protein
VTDPPLLLADEPTGNLDTRTSLEVLALLQELNQKNGITICLVTHEHDIAACASRVVTMRDGRVVSDVRQEKPLDAAAELAVLPPPQEYSAGPEVSALDPVAAARAVLGGPVPLLAYLGMAGGAAAGALVGALYGAQVLGHTSAWLVACAAVLGGSFAGARYGTRLVGHPLKTDQRARLAIHFTAAVALLEGLIALAFPRSLPGPLRERFEGLSSAGIAASLVVALLGVGAVALLHYLLLSLFTPANGRSGPGAMKSHA